MKGVIFDIQRFCLQDGPGIRTTVFLKGCPLRCAWCHNPESQEARPQILYSERDCLRCGACAAACPRKLHLPENGRHAFDPSSCAGCGACAAACPAGALEICGRETDDGEVLAAAMRDADFYRESGGGITLSGGEPMAQSAFALAIARGAREAGSNVCLETCGFCGREELRRMLPYVDRFLYDFKLADSAAHRRMTGAGNARILDNLRFLGGAGADIVLRCPVIPGVNDTDGHFEDILRTALSVPGIRGIDILPYHPLGVEKARRLGRRDAVSMGDPPCREWLEEKARQLRKGAGVPVCVF